jgi:hypothetical protein
MAWNWGDGFDLYADPADMANGYWDSVTGGLALIAGRFSGSRALYFTGSGQGMVKTSSVNDAVHHFVCAFQQPSGLGSSLGVAFQLYDGATAQCSVVFKNNGDILLASGTGGGTVLATYSGAFTNNTWYGFEIEVVINNTTGSFRVRKNGNTVNDFSATGLNTRNSANNYANRVQVVDVQAVGHVIDDFFWRSDASAVAWMGDIRCYTRMPASDGSVQFARAPVTQTPYTFVGPQAIAAGTARYSTFTAACDGTIAAASILINVGYTGNLKTAIFASGGGVPTTVLGSANVLANPVTGSNTITFGTPVAVTKGTQYWIGFDSDTSSGNWSAGGTPSNGLASATAYASFPAASPSTSTVYSMVCSVSITANNNASLVSDAQQDAATSYVYDSTVGHADFYGIASIPATPAVVIATTTRALMQKSDAGARTAAVQLKSGATTVTSSAVALSTSGWLWAWRTDVLDPATSAAWTATAVNNAQIGPLTVS